MSGPIEYSADDFGIFMDFSTHDLFQGRAWKFEVLRRDLVGACVTSIDLRHEGRPGDGDLVEAISPVDDERTPDMEECERTRKYLDDVGGIYPDDLSRSVGRICEWPEQIEDGRKPKFATGRLYILCR